jgi:chemotaxis protein methyltransferase CheR
MNTYSISDKEFSLFQSLIYDKAGISLSAGKKCLVVSRLTKRLRYHGLDNFTQYHDMVTNLSHANELQVMVDLLTTNETYFFREEKHFDFLRDQVLPNHKAGRRFRVWSAAASSGQEPYTLAMVMADKMGIDGKWELMATDISRQILEQARQGCYPVEEAKKIPKHLLNKYCLKGVRSQAGSLLIDRRLRQRIDFQSLNLIGEWPTFEKFSAVFLRNVMIYFDQETKRRLVERIRQHIEPGGYLFIGHSETLNLISKKFRAVLPSIYQRID